MSQNESEHIARVLLGEEKLIHADGQLDIVAVMYLMLLAASPDFEKEVRQIVVEHFDRRLRKCMRAAIPPLLDMLRNRKVVHAISNYMHFIAVSCPAWGIPIEEFTNMEELRRL